MGFSCTGFTAIAFFMISIVVQSFSELVVVRHPLTDNGNTRELTCMSDDDNSALIWNFNYDTDNDAHFQPRRPIREKFNDCAIYGSSTCTATWENIEGWDVVDSVNHPMNPVFDYRWEGFNELSFKNSIKDEDYQHVREVNGAFSTVIFSARGLRNIFILLCTTKDPTKGPCFWIIIGSLNGKQSEIWTCNQGTLESLPSNAVGNCKNITISTLQQNTNVIDIYEWRTFRIEWKDETKMIRVFKDTDAEPFMEGKVDNWHPVSHILIKSEASLRVRFHFYEYFLTEKKDADLSTTGFIQRNADFCVELLVGLCPDCRMSINVTDRNSDVLTTKLLLGNGRIADDKLLSWQSIILNETLSSVFPKLLYIQIQLDHQYGDKRKGQWAIDSFRTCRSVGGLRKSTVTVKRDILNRIPVWLRVNCQKLFYDESAIVDSVSKTTIYEYTDRLQQFSRGLMSCGPSCRNLIENFSLCNSTGCTCNPGFTGSNCTSGCDSGHYGYSCKEECGHCYSEICDAMNGNCTQGCEKQNLLPPFCQKELESPTIVNITDSTARVLQDVELEIGAKIRLTVKQEWQVLKTIDMQRVKSEGISTYEAEISNLTASTTYTVETIVKTKQNIEVSGPRIDFTTKSWESHCFEVIPQQTNAILNINQILQECSKFFNRNSGRLVYTIGRSKPTSQVTIPQPSTNISHLIPYTVYQLTVVGTNSQKWWETEFRTLESAPGKVGNLQTPHVSDIEVTLKWDAPSQKNGIITKYRVSIKSKTVRGCEDLRRTSPRTEIPQEVNDTTAFFSSLHPYTVYSATVIAFTSEQGPEKSLEFTTNKADIPTSVVTNLELSDDKIWLKWDEPEDCTTISAPIRPKRLIFANISHSVQNWTTIMDKTLENNYIDLRNIGLNPYTMYRVRVHLVGRFGRVNETLYREIIWTTPPSAPPAPEDLQVFDTDPDENSISLRWKVPTPPNGEIEFYKVSIRQGSTLWGNWTIEASKDTTMCELWTNYVCLENLKLSPNFPTDSQVQVYAKNKNVEKPGSPSAFPWVLNDYYNKAPGKPPNLTAINQGHGVVMLTWSHPILSHTKIMRFQIVVNISRSYLLKTPGPEYPMTNNYPVRQKQPEYSIMLSLLPSTEYQVTIVAVNKRNRTSDPFEITYSTPEGIGFASEKDPEVKFDGNSLAIEIPTIVNATKNTTLTVIVKGPSTCTSNQLQGSSPELSEKNAVTEWNAKVYQVGTDDTKPLTISAKEYQGVTSTCSLDLNESYTIVFAVTDWYSNVTITTKEPQIDEKGGSLVWLIIIPIIAICFLVFFIFYRKCRRAPLKTSQQNIIQLEPTRMDIGDSTAPSTMKRGTLPPDATLNRVSIRQSSPDVIPSCNPNSCPIKVEKFEEYTKRALTNKLLDSQYEQMSSKSRTKPCEYASLPENLPKNRYKDRIPYDETRVVLDLIPEEPHSDYINASYIQGYRKKKAYIATQGPKPKTVKDFWRMVWQENVRVICMLANVTEGGKKKCEQYWPEVGTKIKYGNILISNTKNLVFADYTFRTFTLRCQKETRELTHFHFTGWPDHGVPMYTQSFVAYLKKLLATSSGTGPVVVHCSAGVGRTGTVILCDICLRQAVAERIIDVPAVLVRMREDRPNMVDNAQQYLLAHLAIVESMIVEQTQIHCDNFFLPKIIELKQQLPFDVQRLKDTVWQDRALHSLETPGHLTQEALTSNRISKLILGNPTVSHSKLSTKEISDGNCIDAMNVDGAKMKDQYIAARLPSTATLSSFWKIIKDRNIELIVMLQRPEPKDRTCCNIVPGESVLIPAPDIQVERKTSPEQKEHFTIDKLLLTDISGEKELQQPVTVLTCTGWGHGKRGKPPTPAALVTLWMASEKISRKEGQTMVLCQDGVTGCGLYLALSFLLERIAVEGECDVISAVRGIRRSKIEFVQSLEQFECLYDAAVNYVKCFEIYANFS